MSLNAAQLNEPFVKNLELRNATIPDEIWLRIFTYAIAHNVDEMTNISLACRRFYRLCGEGILWYNGYRSHYPTWSTGTAYCSNIKYDWRKLLKREWSLEKYWGKGGCWRLPKNDDEIDEDENDDNYVEYESDEDEERREERKEDVVTRPNHHRNYLCRLQELSMSDPLLVDAFKLDSLEEDEKPDIRFSRFLIADFTSTDEGIVANGFYRHDYSASVVRAWSFPDYKLVFEDILRPDDPDLQEHLLEIGWLTKLMVTVVTQKTGDWINLRVYDISEKPKRQLSEFALISQLNGRQVYVIPNWFQWESSLNLSPEVVVVGTEKLSPNRAIVIRHNINTKQTATMYFGNQVYSTYVDPRFPNILITLDHSYHLSVWSTVTGDLLTRMPSEPGIYFDRVALSSVIEAVPSEVAMTKLGDKSNQKQQSLRLIISSVIHNPYQQNRYRLEIWNLTIPNIPFSFPECDDKEQVVIISDQPPDSTIESTKDASVSQVSLRALRIHEPQSGRIYYLRAVGHLLFGMHYSYEFGSSKYFIIAYNLETGKLIYHSQILDSNQNITQLNKALLVVSSEDLYALSPIEPEKTPQHDIVTVKDDE
ncbi:hypothetical protein BDF19DRAFT_421795 [Syncephalis fuscata]|nr:hypothetical protein BDF19DRAFT_421795 [Syncephalis fuscata]